MIVMKRLLLTSLLILAASPLYATDVGISISVEQPGFYGQINIGDFPRPMLIYRDPLIITHTHQGVMLEPIYLYVPPGHAKHWSKHCRSYNACGRRVYFVQESWYNKVYVPRHKEHGHGQGKNHGSDEKHDRGERDRDHGRGHNKD